MKKSWANRENSRYTGDVIEDSNSTSQSVWETKSSPASKFRRSISEVKSILDDYEQAGQHCPQDFSDAYTDLQQSALTVTP